jgi:hypothetical protein
VPWPFDQIGGTVRTVLGLSERAETDVMGGSPLGDVRELESKLDQAVASVERACSSLEQHAEALGALSDTLPALTESVTRLADELGRVMEVTAPLAVAEREASRLDRLLRRRGQAPTPPPAAREPAAPAEEQQEPQPGP